MTRRQADGGGFEESVIVPALNKAQQKTEE